MPYDVEVDSGEEVLALYHSPAPSSPWYLESIAPDRRIIKAFGVIEKAPLQLGTGAVLCMAERFGAFDRNNLIVPIWML